MASPSPVVSESLYVSESGEVSETFKGVHDYQSGWYDNWWQVTSLPYRERPKNVELLADVLKECTGQDRQMKLDVQNDKQDTSETPPDPRLDELAGIGENRWREQDRACHAHELFAKAHVFQNRLIGKPTQLFKEPPSHEHGLITVDDAGASAPEVVQNGHGPQPPIIASESVEKSSGLDGLVCFELTKSDKRAIWQQSISMEKEEPFASRGFCASVHLGGPPFRRSLEADTRFRLDDLAGPIRTPAVYDDDLIVPWLSQQMP